MGHLGPKPIRQAWIMVFSALVMNYLDQGADLMRHLDQRTSSLKGWIITCGVRLEN